MQAIIVTVQPLTKVPILGRTDCEMDEGHDSKGQRQRQNDLAEYQQPSSTRITHHTCRRTPKSRPRVSPMPTAWATHQERKHHASDSSQQKTEGGKRPGCCQRT